MTQSAWAVTAPTITPGSGVYSQVKSTVTITADPGDTIRYTTDGTNPGLSSPVYTTALTIGNTATIKAIAVSGGTPSATTVSNIQSDPNTLSVPRTGLALWLKGDFGTVLSGSNITQWSDLSGSSPANNATQATGANQATLVSSSLNGLPAASFDGSNDSYTLTNQFTDLTTGFSVFAVIKPVGSATRTLVATANSGPADLASLETVNTQGRFNSYNNTTSSDVITATSTLTVGKYQILDAVHDGAGSATVSINSTALNTGSVQNLRNVARAQNILGADSSTSTFWSGELAEILVYSRALTETERKNVQAYLFTRYQLANTTSTPDPRVSVDSGTMSEPSQVAISANADAEIRYSVDGSTPTGSSNLYAGPILMTYSTTLKCIAIANGISSSVVTKTYTLDSTKYPAPDPSDTRALEINLQLPTTAIPD
ncbi:MAG: chitobiase/beta-hexosaminidase C-terminal domain-containing protein [Candidatus Obscuribacter sp.]|nr:chitobiase/beta-hexosaminidase C-terminal domain-containing protein [Candidatus Obscuribacter sp.]